MLLIETFEALEDFLVEGDYKEEAKKYLLAVAEEIKKSRQYDFIQIIALNAYMKICDKFYDKLMARKIAVSRMLEISEVCCFASLYPKVKKAEYQEELDKTLKNPEFQGRVCVVVANYCLQFILRT